MIKKKEIEKIFSISRLFLKKRTYLSNLANDFLFLQSTHPFHLSKYKFVNSKNINYQYMCRYFLEVFKNIIKIVLFFFVLLVTKNYSNINRKLNKKNLIISHLTNLENFKKKLDTQFFGVESEFAKKKFIFFFLDHIKLKNKKKSKLLELRKNVFINNHCIEIYDYNKIVINLIKEFFYILKIAKEKNNFEKKFFLECCKNLLSLSTAKNIILYYNLEKIIIKNKIKNILITMEGHPYEYLIFLLGKIHKINVLAYQTSYITNSHYSMFLNLGNNLSPTKVLANGKIGYELLKKKFNKADVILLGSKKFKKKITTQKKYNNLLVIPSAFEGEAFEFINNRAEELNIDASNMIKPMAIEKYIEERYLSVLHDVEVEYQLGNI